MGYLETLLTFGQAVRQWIKSGEWLKRRGDRPGCLPFTQRQKWFYRLSLMLLAAVLCVSMGGVVTAQITPQITPQSTPQALLNQGRSLYESGQLAEALEAIQAAINQYRTQQNGLGEAVALSNLALVQAQRGALPEAEAAIAASLDHLTTVGDANPSDTHQSALAQSLNVQARIQLAQGQAEAALTTLEWAIALFENLGNQRGVVRSQIRQAEALQTLGFHRAAIAVLKPLYEQMGGAISYGDGDATADDPTRSAQPLLYGFASCQAPTVQPQSAMTVSTVRHLAQAYYQVGRLDRAETLMCESLQLAVRPSDIMAAQLGLANIYRLQATIARSQGDLTTAAAKADVALSGYGAIAQLELPSTTGQLVQVRANLNRLSLLIELDRITEVVTEWQVIQNQLAVLPPSRPKLYAQMNLAKTLMRLQKAEGARATATTQAEIQVIQQELQGAMQYAAAIGDRRAEAFALGYLGELYETQYAATQDLNQWEQAKQLTQQALFLSTQINAEDIAYQWHWQMGRLLTTQAQLDRGATPTDNQTLDEAIAAYQSAIHILERLRQDLATVNQEIQFSFQEDVEPIHRELVDLLLKKDDFLKGKNNGISDADIIEEAQETIESLQLVELTNFLREACVNVDTVDDIEQVLAQSEAAVIYPIILSDRLEIIVSLPDSSSKQTRKQDTGRNGADGNDDATLRRVTVPIAQPDLEDLVGRFYDGVYNLISIGYRPLAREAYDILIRPIETELAASSADTLVFVLDGVLRNIPMGALNDGEQFLVEKYSLALTPGIQLLPNLLASNSLQDEQLSVAALGLSEEVQGFLALPNVDNEIEQIKTVIPNTKALLNQDFTAEGFANLLSTTPAPIVHLATHGQFSSQQENTFVLTWNEKIDIGELSRVLQTGADRRQAPIEMLVLSACQTASGDRRAALGLAGVAIRAGARSTVASLWQVDDAAAAEMMGEFYRQIASQKVSKAEALRQAQLAILNNPQYRRHPYYWAPFVLVGNWR
ncbi:MAG: CHAT domain-containing protein [Cyanothece sp. SIO2G6]|nr:CHAT domain-containing protein [Cyanothece sp. SIO2G6]